MLFLLSLVLSCLFVSTMADFVIEHKIITPSSSGEFTPREYTDLSLLTPSSTTISSDILPLTESTVDTSTWYYTVKISTDSPSSSSTTTSIPFCNILLPGSSVFSKVIKESIVITPNLVGGPLSATLRITNKKTMNKASSLCGVVESSKLKEKFVSNLQTTLEIDLGDKADSIPLKVHNNAPPGLQVLPRPKGDTTFKSMGTDPTKDKEPQQSQSFLGKYWWIILPLAVMTLTAPAEEPGKGK